MLHNLNQESLFPQVSEEELWGLSERGQEVRFAAGDILFSQGDANFPFYVLLEGEVRITRRVGAKEELVRIIHPGEFTGDLAMLAGSSATCNAQTTQSCKLLQIEPDAFRRVISECSRTAGIILAAMTRQAQEVEAQLLQQQKLATLGKLSAGLAHELNNPAASGGRGAKQLRQAIAEVQKRTLDLNERNFTSTQLQELAKLQYETMASPTVVPYVDPIAQSDREDAIAQWLEARGISNGWKLAPNLIWAGIDENYLSNLNDKIGTEALEEVLIWLEANLTVSGLAHEVEQSTARISELVQALKFYSHMERTSLQEIDLYEGIETTLTILQHKIKQGISVKREYEPKLPRIWAYPSELIQVWTNLIDNAIDAMHSQGELIIRTARHQELVLVAIADNGPGIPMEIQSRIFEPFFTTKHGSEGTGLGLDIVRRIIEKRHQGSISFDSRPGKTCFQIHLPIKPQNQGV
jgi:signal transduction histidine kinase